MKCLLQSAYVIQIDFTRLWSRTFSFSSRAFTKFLVHSVTTRYLNRPHAATCGQQLAASACKPARLTDNLAPPISKWEGLCPKPSIICIVLLSCGRGYMLVLPAGPAIERTLNFVPKT